METVVDNIAGYAYGANELATSPVIYERAGSVEANNYLRFRRLESIYEWRVMCWNHQTESISKPVAGCHQFNAAFGILL